MRKTDDRVVGNDDDPEAERPREMDGRRRARRRGPILFLCHKTGRLPRLGSVIAE